MKKIIQRTKRFEKMFVKLSKKLQNKFLEKLELFIDDEFNTSLDTHQLKGKQMNEWSFSLTGDYRVIYTKKVTEKRTLIVFTLIRVGTHNTVYKQRK